jgi:hypothetical protein
MAISCGHRPGKMLMMIISAAGGPGSALARQFRQRRSRRPKEFLRAPDGEK